MKFEQIKSRVDAYVDEVWEDVVADIAALVAVESVEDTAAALPGAPWGPGPREALTRALAIAERLGLEARDLAGAIGYGDVPGASEHVIATIAHCDIVPLGGGWHFDPLALTRREGYLIGRGVFDDKGPLVLSLWAAAFFRHLVEETGEPLPHTLRCIIGANEETGMGDVDAYLDACGEPDFCFSPDADFPLICGEKGIFHGAFTSSFTLGQGGIVEMDGGTAANAIPGHAEALVRAEAAELPEAAGVEVELAGNGLVRVIATGKGGHASLPAGTVNAIGILAAYLLDNVELTEDEVAYLTLMEKICSVSDGSGAGVACTDARYGALTAIGGTIKCADGRLEQTIDIRYPDTVTGEGLADTLAAFASAHCAEFRVLHDAKPFYIEPSSPEIRALLDTYDEYTGGHAEPIVIGGGTYARHFARACAFGPNEPGLELPDWVGYEHGPDEGISEELMRRALKIYIVSIARLMELEL